MKKTYPHLLSPLKINGAVLKNRIGFPVAPVHFLVGNEDQPNDAYITFHANLAKAGAAYINMNEWNNPLQHTVGLADSLHMPMFDTSKPGTWNYINQLTEAVHFYGSKVTMMISQDFPEGYSLNGGRGRGFPGMVGGGTPQQALPVEMMEGVIDQWIAKVDEYRLAGVDMITAMLSFAPNPGNKREDEYGNQTLESRTLFQRQSLAKLKKAFGKDFLVETIVAGECDQYTTAQLAEALKLYEGLIDIVTIRERDVVASHPTGFTFAHIGDHKVTDYARELKALGVKQAIAINGGFQDLDEIEGYLAEGICDIVSIGRGLFAEPELLKKAKEGRGEDVTPCIWCNKCHGVGFKGPWLVFCSVNPQMGLETKVKRLTEPVEKIKKVAVIGGGPIGMRAALFTAERGHKVTLFEKSEKLGGQLSYSDYMKFKWPIRNHRDWLIRQVEKSAIKVVLNCAPAAADLEAQNFDVIIAATGATPNLPPIKGITKEDGTMADKVRVISQVWGKEDELGQKIVLVGAAESGIETAIHLAQKGKDVIALTRQTEVAPDANHPHYITMTWIDKGPNASPMGTSPEWQRYPNLQTITQATTVEVGGGKVVYKDADGAEHILECDDVVISGGMNRNADAALAYSDAAPDFYMIGDCSEFGGDLRKGYREAWAVASQI